MELVLLITAFKEPSGELFCIPRFIELNYFPIMIVKLDNELISMTIILCMYLFQRV